MGVLLIRVLLISAWENRKTDRVCEYFIAVIKNVVHFFCFVEGLIHTALA